MNKNKKLLLSLICIFILTSGFGCTNNIFKKKATALKPITLNVWGVYEENENLKILFNKFKKIHPSVTLKYRKFRFNEYEDQLINAWAEDKGPDIYLIPNNWVRKFETKISPLTSRIKLPYREVKQTGIGGFQKTDIIDYVKEVKTTSINELIKNYPQIIYKDVVINSKIHGLPLSLETMGVFYNKDMLNNANIPLPPSTWTEFKNAVNSITLLNEKGNFIQSGTALGTTSNITNSADIITLLIQQNGIDLNKNAYISFGNKNDSVLSLQAINFFNDFSNPIKETYSWNEKQSSALESFINGQVAFFFGYPYQIQQIKSRAPKLNFGITKVPQIENTNNTINSADYWLMTVSHKAKDKDIAWGFVNFASKKENVEAYLEKTKKPTALNSLIDKQKNDLEIGPFAEQILTADSWYQGKNPELAEKYINEMTDNIKNGNTKYKPSQLLELSASRINQTIK